VYDYIIATDESASKGETDIVGNTSKEVERPEVQNETDCENLDVFWFLSH
jgi:hypothetical protein